MADNYSSRGAEARYPGGDPFAELSRIISREPPQDDSSESDDLDFDMDLESEVPGMREDRQENGDNSPNARFDNREDVEAPASAEFADPLADEFADAFSAEFGSDGRWRDEPAPSSSEAAPASPDDDWRSYQPYESAPVPTEAMLAEVDMDFGELDLTDEIPALEPDATPEVEALEPEGDSAEEEPAFEQAAPFAAAPRSIEDELGALLADESAPAEGPEETAVHIPLRSAPVFEPAAESRFPDAAAPVDDDPYGDEIGADLEPHASHEAQSTAYDPHEEEFQEAEAEVEPAPIADPFAVFAGMAPAAPVFSRAIHDLEPQPQPGLRSETPDAGDEFATVGVAENSVPVQDDLDIPDVDYRAEEHAVPALDSEYEFGELPMQHPAEQAESTFAAGAGAEAYEPQWQPFEDEQQAPHADDALYAEYVGVPEEQAAEAQMPVHPVAASDEPRRRGSGLLIAAVVAGVAIIGGVGAFALSFGDSDEAGAPTLVRADSDPLKVKPENPGGAAEPANQDSQTYQRVAEGQAETPTQQEQLVTAAEEPINLAARAQPVNGLPGVEDEIGELDIAPPAKGDDRVASAEEALGVGTNEDLIAVQPRRVRTMIVRPDGTLVAREDAAPLVASAPDSALPPAVTTAEPLAPATEAEPVVEVAAVETPEPAEAAGSLPAPRSVETVRITPESQAAAEAAATETAASQPVVEQPTAEAVAAPAPRPSEPQATTQVAQAAAPARTQPAAPAAAVPGEWSMQIASQPTADGAQATYQELARRYGSVIGGRGVNIVKADIPGKGIYYRVRIPSTTRSDAISLCERYKSAGGSCFVSK